MKYEVRSMIVFNEKSLQYWFFIIHDHTSYFIHQTSYLASIGFGFFFEISSTC